jgi:hypothetical protein
MKKATFDPKGVTATLINRVHRTGITMMTTINKVQNKSESVNPKVIEDLETDYLLANVELENMLKSQLAQKNKDGWELFVDSVNKLGGGEKPIFRGVVQNVKQTAENILAGSANPFTTQPFELPPYILPYFPTAPAGIDPNFWKTVFNDAEKLEASTKDVATNLTEAAEHAALAIVEAAAGEPIGAVVESFHTGYSIGEAINDYMGWKKE